MTTDVEIGGPLPEKKPAEEVAFLNKKMDDVRTARAIFYWLMNKFTMGTYL